MLQKRYLTLKLLIKFLQVEWTMCVFFAHHNQPLSLLLARRLTPEPQINAKEHTYCSIQTLSSFTKHYFLSVYSRFNESNIIFYKIYQNSHRNRVFIGVQRIFILDTSSYSSQYLIQKNYHCTSQ